MCSLISLTEFLDQCCPQYATKRLTIVGDMLITVTALSNFIVACLVYSTRRLKLKCNELGV
jgi:hypothetical protein